MSMRRCGFCGDCGHYRTTCPQRLETLAAEARVAIAAMEVPTFTLIASADQGSTVEEMVAAAEVFHNAFHDSTALHRGSRAAPLPSAPLPSAPLPSAPLPSAPLPSAPLPPAPVELVTTPVINEPVETNTCCPICMEDLTAQPKTQLLCNHSFCTKCIMRNLEYGNLCCPMCRSDVMGPSKKIKDLETKIQEQHEELCEFDETMKIHQVKFNSYEKKLEEDDKIISKLYKDMNDITHSLGLTNFATELQPFIQGITLEYKKLLDNLSEYDATIVPPSLHQMIQSIFTTKSLDGMISRIFTHDFCFELGDGDPYHRRLSIPGSDGVILTNDCWVKVVSGRYRNHMGRIVLKPGTIVTPAYFVVRVFRGLGKPKLGEGVYDCSYTEDIKLYLTSGAGDSNCIISRFMVRRVPDSVVTLNVQGNAVALPKDIRRQLRQGKIEVLLNRIHTAKTGGVMVEEVASPAPMGQILGFEQATATTTSRHPTHQALLEETETPELSPLESEVLLVDDGIVGESVAV